jgi:hypothetical protein
MGILWDCNSPESINMLAIGTYPLELFFAKLRKMCFHYDSAENVEYTIKKILCQQMIYEEE